MLRCCFFSYYWRDFGVLISFWLGSSFARLTAEELTMERCLYTKQIFTGGFHTSERYYNPEDAFFRVLYFKCELACQTCPVDNCCHFLFENDKPWFSFSPSAGSTGTNHSAVRWSKDALANKFVLANKLSLNIKTVPRYNEETHFYQYLCHLYLMTATCFSF